ncbi:MAG: phosphate/phosphite/phosphonate ABC transporter substrate-binding protein [Bacteroidetes bacterium]|nr:phosphate/phosphite/phosphonate ABC transporter substrate-binding protein [Bacteroidota bacterium]
MKLINFCLIFLATSFFLSCEFRKTEPFTFGFIPASEIEEVEIVADSLCTELTKQTGIEIRSFVAPDYSSLIEAIRTRHVDIAWLAPMSFVEAEAEIKQTPLLTSVRQGKPFFYSAIFTRTDSGIRSVEDLNGKRIGWTDPTSTAGRIFPEYELRKKGINPATFFREIKYVGGHDRAVKAVLDGDVDAAASFANDTINTDNAWHQFVKDKEQIAKIRPILYTKPIPGDVISMSTHVYSRRQADAEKLKKAILAFSVTSTGKRLIKKLNRTDALAPVQPEMYETVREAAKYVLGQTFR